MPRLTANPESRVRSSKLGLPSEYPLAEHAQRSRGLLFLPIFVIFSGLILTALLISTFNEDGEESGRDWVLQTSRELLFSFSVESGLVVQEFAISGNRFVASKLLVDAVGIRIGTPMISVDLHDALAGVNKITWVRSAHVSRHWPNKIAVKVVEKIPIAVWETVEGSLFIDEEGEAFGEQYMGEFIGLPILQGIGAGQRFPELVRVLEISPIVGREVVGATLVAQRRWDVRMAKNFIVRLPEEGMELAWILFSDHLKRKYLPLEGLAVADYTIRDRVVLQYKKGLGDSLVNVRSFSEGVRGSDTPDSLAVDAQGPG